MSDVDIGDLREDWKNHGYTVTLKKRAEAELGAATLAFDAACESSGDPKVRGTLERLKGARRLLQILNNGAM